jgi:hypothetical protein
MNPLLARRWARADGVFLAVTLVLALAVIAQALVSVIQFRDIFPFGDMDDVLARYFAGPAKDYWIYHDNEHLPLFAMPLYWIDFRAFQAQGVFLTGCILTLATAIGLAPARALLRLDGSRMLRPCAIAATILASIVWLGSYINLVWTHQVHMYLAVFAVTIAIRVAASSEARGNRHIAVMVAWLIVAMFSFGSGIMGFPAVFAIGLIRRWTRRHLAIMAAAFFACVTVYAILAFPVLHATLAAQTHVGGYGAGTRGLYALTFLGSPSFNMLAPFLPLAWALGAAWCLACIGLTVFIRYAAQSWTKPPGEIVAWAMGFGVFTLLLDAETTLARASVFGYVQAADGRYIIGQLPFWIGLLMIATQRALAGGVRARTALSSASMAIGAGLLASQQGILPAMRAHNHDRWSSAMSAIDNVADPGVYFRDDMFYVHHVPAMIDGFRAQGWSVYAWKQSTWIGRKIESFGTMATACSGHVDTVAQAGKPDGWRVDGWAADGTGRDAQWVLLADRTGLIRGLAHRGGARPDLNRAGTGQDLLYAGWTGYVRTAGPAPNISAYLLLKDKHPCRIDSLARSGA